MDVSDVHQKPPRGMCHVRTLEERDRKRLLSPYRIQFHMSVFRAGDKNVTSHIANLPAGSRARAFPRRKNPFEAPDGEGHWQETVNHLPQGGEPSPLHYSLGILCN